MEAGMKWHKNSGNKRYFRVLAGIFGRQAAIKNPRA